MGLNSGRRGEASFGLDGGGHHGRGVQLCVHCDYTVYLEDEFCSRRLMAGGVD
jgi:hypothetical protein